jgi:hypothetical protein
MSDRTTCRKLIGSPAARAAASLRLTTSYGGETTRAGQLGHGAQRAKGTELHARDRTARRRLAVNPRPLLVDRTSIALRKGGLDSRW